VPSPTAHVVCRRKLCSDPCFCCLYFSRILQNISPVAWYCKQVWCLSQSVCRKRPPMMQYTVTNLQICLFDVHTWFNHNELIINPEKSEVLLLSTVQHARASSSRCEYGWLCRNDSLTDRHSTLDSHVQNVYHSAYYHIRPLKHFRSSLETDMAKAIASE